MVLTCEGMQRERSFFSFLGFEAGGVGVVLGFFAVEGVVVVSVGDLRFGGIVVGWVLMRD